MTDLNKQNPTVHGGSINNLHEQLTQKILHGHNPYAGFPVKQWSGTWYGDVGACHPAFKQAIELVKPEIVVEVGSFVGESTIHMAKLLRKVRPGAVILAIDTWMGGIDHWMKVPQKLRFWFGRPSLYYQFIGNVMAHQCEDIIIPVSLDSLNGGRLLKFLGVRPGMVYVDASHEEGDVLRDYEMYWDLLLPSGAFMVDDLSPDFFPGVCADWGRFVTAHKVKPILEAWKGLIVKP